MSDPPRTPPVDPAHLTPLQRQVREAALSGPRAALPAPLIPLLHAPAIAGPYQALGAEVRFRTRLPPRLSELAVLVVARRWNSRVEWTIHAPIAERSGLGAEVVAAVAGGRSPPLVDRDGRAVYAFAREMALFGDVADDTFAEARACFGLEGVVELSALVGYYAMTAMVLNVHRTPAPEGAGLTLAVAGADPAPLSPLGALAPDGGAGSRSPAG